MRLWYELRHAVSSKSRSLGPGSHAFLKSLSIVTLCFAISKVFSSAAMVIMARYLGRTVFGEASVVLLVSQNLSLFMLCGLNVAIMRYGALKERADQAVATSLFLVAVTSAASAAVFWLVRDPLARLLDLNESKMLWALGLGVLFTSYVILTSVYQVRSLFKARGIIEVAFAALLLPALALGGYLMGRSYQSMLMAYGLGYLLCLPFMVWRFRDLFSPRLLFAPHTREIMAYGSLALVSNVGYILTFIVQPLQLQHIYGEDEVALFRLYCGGSVYLATFASTIFYTVFFPKVSASTNKRAIWNRLNRAWMRAAVPMTVFYAVIMIVTVFLSGREYPLIWSQVVLFGMASTLITIATTYGQIVTSQGVRGMRWGLAISLGSGVSNYVLSALLIPKYGISGAAFALAGNYALTLLFTFAVRNTILNMPAPQDPPEPAPPAVS